MQITADTFDIVTNPLQSNSGHLVGYLLSILLLFLIMEKKKKKKSHGQQCIYSIISSCENTFLLFTTGSAFFSLHDSQQYLPVKP